MDGESSCRNCAARVAAQQWAAPDLDGSTENARMTGEFQWRDSQGKKTPARPRDSSFRQRPNVRRKKRRSGLKAVGILGIAVISSVGLWRAQESATFVALLQSFSRAIATMTTERVVPVPLPSPEPLPLVQELELKEDLSEPVSPPESALSESQTSPEPVDDPPLKTQRRPLSKERKTVAKARAFPKNTADTLRIPVNVRIPSRVELRRKQVEQQIEQAILHRAIEGVEVSLIGGTAFLRGHVQTISQKDAAEEAARGIPGVGDVRNLISVVWVKR
jgi:hypothetical protein